MEYVGSVEQCGIILAHQINSIREAQKRGEDVQEAKASLVKRISDYCVRFRESLGLSYHLNEIGILQNV